MKKTKLFKPYLPEKNNAGGNICTLKKTGAGVYLIYKNSALVYVGYSGADVKKTMYRHFQIWNDKRSTAARQYSIFDRTTYQRGIYNGDIKCRVIFCNTAAQAARLEQVLILKLRPKDNLLKLAAYTKAQEAETISAYNAADIAADTDVFNDVPF